MFPKNAHKNRQVFKDACKPQVLIVLKDKALTIKEIASFVKRDEKTVAKILRGLGEDQAYICEWRGFAQVWTLGKGKHLPRPVSGKSKKVSTNERHKDAYLLKRPFVTGERIWGI